jgi:D-amino-acid dehydrogenase
MTSRRDDVLVLGAGVIGLSCALELLKAGRGVTVIDAGRIGGGSSHGNCGTITPSHAIPLAGPGMISKALGWMLRPDAPLYVKPRFDPALARWLLHFAARCNARDQRAGTVPKGALLQASRTLLEANIREEGLACEFDTPGLTYVYRDARSLDDAAELVATLGAIGVRAEILDATRLAREEPALRDGMAGGVHFPDDAVLRPDRLVAELARRVRERGGAIIEQCAATGFTRRSDGGIASVATAQGERAAEQVVFACGAWSPRAARDLDLRLPIQPGKGYSITYSRPAQAPRRPLVLRERSVCVTTWGSGYRLGSTMEFSGYDSSLNRVRLDALARGAAEYLRDPVGASVQEEWYGWRPMTWDDLPILGHAASIPNLMFATGHGMMGVSMSAITGRLVADLLCGRAPSLDPRPYSPRRFGL